MWPEFPGALGANISVAWASQSERRELNLIGEFGAVFVDFNNLGNIKLQNEQGRGIAVTDF
ncbi:MAG: hypothetical protein ACI8T6_001355 [Candidatus Poseidoniaceae archaeon]|jgi:hypothetical protein